MGSLNAVRSDLQIPDAARPSDVHDACAVCVVTSPTEFEPVAAFPPNVCFVGPFIDGPALMKRGHDVVVDQDLADRVVVSFSTCGQRQLEPLQRVVDALAELPVEVLVTTGAAVDPESVRAGGNARVVDFVPHQRVVPGASLVVTHAGMGTIMRALAYGVPLVCMPMGRDQFFNAARVEALGAGVTVSVESPADVVRDAVHSALANRSLQSNARHMAGLIATYRGEAEAVERIEALGP